VVQVRANDIMRLDVIRCADAWRLRGALVCGECFASAGKCMGGWRSKRRGRHNLILSYIYIL
jgi:hypothetical protein